MAPRVTGRLTVQATMGLSTTIEAPTHDREPHLRPFPFCFSFTSSARPQHRSSSATSAIAIASASSCLFAPLPPLKLHYSPLLLVHLAVSRRTKVAATFVTSAATAMSATSPEFEATVVGIARVPLILLFLPS